MSVVCTGSIAFDYILSFKGRFKDHILPDKTHMINLSFLVDSLKKRRGGVAGNYAYNLALLGKRSIQLHPDLEPNAAIPIDSDVATSWR